MSERDYATSLVKQYDKNGNMMLDGDEVKQLHGRAAESDLNKDGTITIDELVAHLSTPASTASSPSTSTTSSASSSSGSSSGDSSGRHSHNGDGKGADPTQRVFLGSAGGLASTTKEGDKRHSYRFSTAEDRLPKGVPDWFREKDTDGDGQVSMSEFSHSWNKSTVDRFRGYDTNNDGMISAKEVLAKP